MQADETRSSRKCSALKYRGIRRCACRSNSRRLEFNKSRVKLGADSRLFRETACLARILRADLRVYVKRSERRAGKFSRRGQRRGRNGGGKRRPRAFVSRPSLPATSTRLLTHLPSTAIYPRHKLHPRASRKPTHAVGCCYHVLPKAASFSCRRAIRTVRVRFFEALDCYRTRQHVR